MEEITSLIKKKIKTSKKKNKSENFNSFYVAGFYVAVKDEWSPV